MTVGTDGKVHNPFTCINCNTVQDIFETPCTKCGKNKRIVEETKMKKFNMIGMNEDDPYEIEAENKLEAYFNFIEVCLGIKLTAFQKEDSLKELCVGNPIFDMIECEEILE